MQQDKARNTDRIIQVILAIIGAAATIYAGFQATTIVTITTAQTAIVGTTTQEELEAIQAPSQTPYYVTQLVEVTREVPVTQLVEVTREVTPLPTAPLVLPGQSSLNIDYDGRTNREEFIFKLTTIDITPNNRIRLNMYFWNQSNINLYIRFFLDNCAYVSDRDTGIKYQILESNVNNFTDTRDIKVQPQTRLDYWFEFEDVISEGVKHLTINLCPDGANGFTVSFTPFDIDLTP